ncbi:hypothetical protein D9757_014553 [Collybiopsis confluens]|uniref:Ubiquitin-like protease family profile domain-containing protein n=1 Tax=Collybiopsis confluens TaxID=2823264 RepID=A0A8H5CZ12_9AGAR|nr:hypothetical protein D9757_014553 [Collybiopsis confluens]
MAEHSRTSIRAHSLQILDSFLKKTKHNCKVTECPPFGLTRTCRAVYILQLVHLVNSCQLLLPSLNLTSLLHDTRIESLKDAVDQRFSVSSSAPEEMFYIESEAHIKALRAILPSDGLVLKLFTNLQLLQEFATTKRTWMEQALLRALDDYPETTEARLRLTMKKICQGQDPFKDKTPHISVKNFSTLGVGRWVDDKIINYFVAKWCRQSSMLGLTTFFACKSLFRDDSCSTAKSSTLTVEDERNALLWCGKRVKYLDIEHWDSVFIPINENRAHWYSAYIDFRLKRIEIFDSLETICATNREKPLSRQKNTNLMLVLMWLAEVLGRLRGEPIVLKNDPETEWVCQPHSVVPFQPNSHDCGIHSLWHLQHLLQFRQIRQGPIAGGLAFTSNMVGKRARLAVHKDRCDPTHCALAAAALPQTSALKNLALGTSHHPLVEPQVEDNAMDIDTDVGMDVDDSVVSEGASADAEEVENTGTANNPTYRPMNRSLQEDEDNTRTYQWHPTAGKIYGYKQDIHQRWKHLFSDSEVDAHESYHPFSSRLEWELAQWAIKQKISHSSFDRLLRIPEVKQRLGVNFKNARSMLHKIDQIPGRCGEWYTKELAFKDRPEEKFIVWHRNPLDAIKALWGDPSFSTKLVYKPVKVFKGDINSEEERLFSEMWTGSFWNAVQEKIPEGGTIAPVIIASDKTQLTQFSGSKTAYPVYLTIGNLPKALRRKPGTRACVLIAYLAIDKPSKSGLSTTALKLRNYEIFHRSMAVVLEPLKAAGHPKEGGIEMIGGDGAMRKVYPLLATYVADYPEQCLITCTKYGTCPKCRRKATELELPIPGEPRTQQWTTAIISAARKSMHGKGDNRIHALTMEEDVAGGDFDPFWMGFPLTDIHRCITPDVLHQLYLDVLKYLVLWAQQVVGEEELDKRIQALPAAHGVRHFGKGISTLSQASGTEYKHIARILLACLTGKMDPKGIIAVRSILHFINLAQYPSHDQETLEYMKIALNTWHQNRSYFILHGLRQHFNIPKFHSLLHYVDSIRWLGTTDNFNTEYFERLHIDFAKEGWRASNKRDHFPQMVQWLSRQEKVASFDFYQSWVDSESDKPVSQADSDDQSTGDKETGSLDEAESSNEDSETQAQTKTQIKLVSPFHLAKSAHEPAKKLTHIVASHAAPTFISELKLFLNSLLPAGQQMDKTSVLQSSKCLMKEIVPVCRGWMVYIIHLGADDLGFMVLHMKVRRTPTFGFGTQWTTEHAQEQLGLIQQQARRGHALEPNLHLCRNQIHLCRLSAREIYVRAFARQDYFAGIPNSPLLFIHDVLPASCSLDNAHSSTLVRLVGWRSGSTKMLSASSASFISRKLTASKPRSGSGLVHSNAGKSGRRALPAIDTNLNNYDRTDSFQAFSVLVKLIGSLSSRIRGCQYRLTPQEHRLSLHFLNIVEPNLGYNSFHISSRVDLLNLAMNCSRMHSIVIPRRFDYRIIKCKLSSIRVWNHLSVHQSLALNVRRLEVLDKRALGSVSGAQATEVVPGGVSSTDTDSETDLEDTDDELAKHEKQERYLLNALSKMTHLESFVWSCSHLPISIDLLWPMLLKCHTWKEVDISDNVVFSSVVDDESEGQTSKLAVARELRTVALRSTKHVYGSAKHPDFTRVKGMLNSCPNLESLDIAYVRPRS